MLRQLKLQDSRYGRFALIHETDGARNEKKEPDALYLWTR
jgi:hypothetical protein